MRGGRKRKGKGRVGERRKGGREGKKEERVRGSSC
jgi:hypothetical protein